MRFYLILMIPLLAFEAAAEKAGEDVERKPDIFVRLLSEQISGDHADYQSASPEWKLVMEARIRSVMFTYWINVEKFKVPRHKIIETRFGELAALIEEQGAFPRTFVEPHFVKSADSFPVHGYVSVDGERFEIRTAPEFERENQMFLKFLRTCMAEAKSRN
jgi:hypothetical protein